MFSRFFESNQDKVRRLRDACPDFAFSGWGSWYAWDQALLGYPVCRLFESEREAKQYQSAVFPDSNTFNLYLTDFAVDATPSKPLPVRIRPQSGSCAGKMKPFGAKMRHEKCPSGMPQS